MPRLDANEARRRRPLWEALSNVCLDTETRVSLPGLALVIHHSGYDDETVRRIAIDEVLPEHGGNLLSVTGEWAALHVDPQRMARRAERGPGLRGRLLRVLLGAHVRREVDAALALAHALGAAPTADRSLLVRAWRAIAHSYFGDDAGTALSLRALGDTAIGRTRLERTWREDAHAPFRSALAPYERLREQERIARVSALLESVDSTEAGG